MIGPDGDLWWTTTEAREQLGVRAERLRDWVRRSRQAGHTGQDCRRCANGKKGFPHVDPPVRAGPLAAYRAEQLMEAERHTATSTRGGVARRGA